MNQKFDNLPEGITPETLKQLLDNRPSLIEATKESFFWFFYIYFGRYFTYPVAPFHLDMIKIAQDETIKRATVMAFRGSAKSTILNTAFALWCVMGVPQKKHIVIASQTQQRSKDHLMNIRKEIENNKLLNENLGPFQETEDRWHSTTLIIPKYRARITAISVEEGIRGLREGPYRPDVIICDDIEDSNSVKTIEGRDKTYNWLTGELIPLGDINTKVVILGNFLGEDSVLSRIEEKITNKGMDGIFLKVPIVYEGGRISWPGKFPDVEAVEKLKRSIGNELTWQRDYLLHAIPGDLQVIDPKWIHRYDKLPGNEHYLLTITGVDLACGGENSDFTAIVSIKVYHVNNKICFYVLPEVVNEKISIPEAIDRLSIICKSLKSSIALENTILETAFSQDPKLERIEIEFLKLKSRDKRTRLAALSNAFFMGQILFPKKGARSDKLIEQILGFGNERHNDLVDAFACAMHIALEKKYATDLRTVGI